MKLVLSLSLALFVFASCSKCYECKAPVEVQTPDTTYTTYQTEELCTANKNDVATKEDQGYVCK